MMMGSSITYSKSGSCEIAANVRHEIPFRLPLLKRRKTLLHSPNHSGGSRQGEPVRTKALLPQTCGCRDRTNCVCGSFESDLLMADLLANNLRRELELARSHLVQKMLRCNMVWSSFFRSSFPFIYACEKIASATRRMSDNLPTRCPARKRIRIWVIS
jgi:hypothetical protein